MAKDRIATIKGVWVRPGVSKNNRWYKPEHIAAAVEEAQSAISSGNAPVVAMLTHHGARDPKVGDVTRTAGRITKVGVDRDGNGTFEAELADTAAGRDVAALTTPEHPYLKGVSMASAWKSEPRMVQGPTGHGMVETANGFSLKGIDFTHNPGVTGAEIHSAEVTESAQGDLICESLEEVIFVEQTDGGTPTTQEAFADLGYHGEKRFKITTPSDIRGSWVAIHQKPVTESYSPKQLSRIRNKVTGAAKKAGFDVVEETALLGIEILEAYASVCVDNGPADMRVSAYVDDPSKLKAVTQTVALATLAALTALDPDNDGDIDLPGGAVDDADDDVLSPCCGCVLPAGAVYCPICGLAVPQNESAPADPGKKGAEMPTDAPTPGSATESVTMTKEQLDEALKGAATAALEAAGVKPVVEESDELKAARKLIAEADSDKPAPVVEAAPGDPAAVVETQGFSAEDAAKLVDEALAKQNEAFEAKLTETRKEIAKTGLRKGHISKDLLEQAPEDLYGADAELPKASTQSLEKLTDDVFAPMFGG